MASSDSSVIDTLNNVSIVLHQYVIPVIYILATLGNLLSAIIFAKKSWRKNVCVLYFDVCLVFNTCYMNSTMIGSIFVFGFKINLLARSAILCKLYSYTSFLFSTLFPTILILASIDRLLISSQDVDTRLYSSKRLAYLLISVSTFSWTVYFFHLLIMINVQEIFPSFFVCYFERSQTYRDFVSYSSLIINSSFFVIMMILSMFAFKNVRRIRAIPRLKRQQVRSMTKKDFQLLRCLFVHDVVYIIFNIPISVYMFYAAATTDQRRTRMDQALLDLFSALSIFLHHIPFCASVVIFLSTSKAFRTELKRMIYRLSGRAILPLREEEHIEMNNVQVNVIDVQSVVLPA